MQSPPDLAAYERKENAGLPLTLAHLLLPEVLAKLPNATRCNQQALTTLQQATSFPVANLGVRNKRDHQGYYSTPLIRPQKHLLFWRKERPGGPFLNTAAPNQ